MPRTWPENGVTTVSKVAVSSTLLVLLGHAVTEMLSHETKLLAVSVAWAGLYLLQRVLVGRRRCSGHWLVQYGAWAAYYLPPPLALYAARAVYSTSHIDEFTPYLVTGVLLMFVTTVFVLTPRGVLFTNMRAYSLRDRPRDRYSFLMWLVFLGCVEWEWARIPSANPPRRLELVWRMVPHFGALFVILFYSTSESTLDCQTKAVADYMKRVVVLSRVQQSTSPFFDDDATPNSNSSLQLLDCCRYPFVQARNGEWVTVKDLVQRDDLPNEDKDIWLSYSRCRLLARRYYGFHCAEEGDEKVRRFALADLGTTDGYKRAFKTVEVQLAFLHDYFFTASLPILESGLSYVGIAQMLTIALRYVIATFSIAIPLRDDLVSRIAWLVGALLWMFMSWFLVSGMPMFLVFGMPMSPVQNLLAIYWHPIHTAFHKLNYLPDAPNPIVSLVRLFHSTSNPNAQDTFYPFQSQTDGAYWRNKIGQYSILHDYNRGRSPKKALEDWFHRIMLSQPSYKFIKHLPVEEDEVDMQKLDKMRELVANTLHSINGPPTNGTRSLKINRDSAGYEYDWSWTCRQETHTDTILIWHIATCYCGMTPPHSYRHNGLRLVEIDTWYEVAMALSRYCAYLVAFLPQFLPEHSLTTKFVFQRVLQEAQQVLGTEPMEEEEKRTKIQGCLWPWCGQTFHKGIMLGRQLEKLNTRLRWKVMAEFWAETILYIAPSDNAEAHIEHLAKGGEFITHLWAMLSNAGILKRATGEWHPPSASTTTEGEPPTRDQQNEALFILRVQKEALSSSIDEASTSSMSFPPRQTSEPPINEKGKQPQILEDLD